MENLQSSCAEGRVCDLMDTRSQLSISLKAVNNQRLCDLEGRTQEFLQGLAAREHAQRVLAGLPPQLRAAPVGQEDRRTGTLQTVQNVHKVKDVQTAQSIQIAPTAPTARQTVHIQQLHRFRPEVSFSFMFYSNLFTSLLHFIFIYNS